MTPTRPALAILQADGRGVPAAAFAVVLALFLPTLTTFHTVWTAQPNTHGYWIAGGTLWLIWRERAVFGSVRGWTGPLSAVLALSVLWLLATVMTVQFAAQGAVPLLALAWSAAVFGPDALRRLGPVAAVFMIAVPLWSLNEPLRLTTVAVTTASLGALAIPATIDGSTIHLAHGSFVIADACAGLNFFMAGLAVGGFYAVAFVERSRARAAILALAVGLSVAANWVRVTSLIVIGHVTRMEAAVIYDHGLYGWLIFFAFVLALFFPLAHALERRLDGGSPSTAEPPEEPASTTSGRPGRSPVLLATAAAAVGPALYVVVAALPAADAGEPVLGASSWSLAADSARPFGWRPAFAGAELESHSIWSNERDRLTVDRLVYGAQGQRTELIAFGNRIAPDALVVMERLYGPVGTARRYVNEAIVREGDTFLLVWYWYRVGGVETASPLKAKLLEIPAFVRRLRSTELIALGTACEADSCLSASAELADFLGDP